LTTDDIETTLRRAIADVVGQVSTARIIGIGIASMAEAGVLVGVRDRPVGPTIAWFDTRGASEAAMLADRLPGFSRHTGLPLTNLCSLAKYAWLRGNVAKAAHGRRWFSLAEWVAWRLGGEPLAERSLASRTGWLDVVDRAVWPDALQAVAAPPGFQPSFAEAGASTGTARGDFVAGDALVRLRGATITIAGLDHLASGIGAGITDGLEVLDSCGTVEAFVITRREPPDRTDLAAAAARGLTVGVHVLPGSWAWLGALRSGAVLRGVLDQLETAPDPLRAGTAEPVSSAATFVGDDPGQVRIPAGSDPSACWRAAIEHLGALGVGLLDELRASSGSDPVRIVACGGWLRDSTARSVKQRLLGERLSVSAAREAGTRGAALLAGVAAGLYPRIDAIPLPTADAHDTGLTSRSGTRR
jgi:sugar (pentulose or hexulose) kinase